MTDVQIFFKNFPVRTETCGRNCSAIESPAARNGSYKMELNKKFFASLRRRRFSATRRILSQHAGWTIALVADSLYGIINFECNYV